MELSRVVFRSIEELTVAIMTVFVVLGLLDVEVGNPAKLTENVPLLANFCVVGHPSSLYFVLFVGVKLATRLLCDVLLLPEGFIEIFLKNETWECLPCSNSYFGN